MNSFLIGIFELDRGILLTVSPQSLINTCQKNFYAQQICEDISFWKDRIINDYGPSMVNLIPTNITFLDFYFNLVQYAPEHAINLVSSQVSSQISRTEIIVSLYNKRGNILDAITILSL
jgi:hypothetical protein